MAPLALRRHRRSARRRVATSSRLHLETLEARVVLDSTVVFSEVMYNPRNGADLEWLELHNQMAVRMDVSGWTVDGIGYTFPDGTVLEPGSYTVIGKSPAALAAAGIAGALGPYNGQLSNSGETLQLINNSARVMDELTYQDSADWPVGPDGSGASLAKVRPNSGSEPPSNWASSHEIGGTPGAANFMAGPRTGPTSTLVPLNATWRYDDTGADHGDTWLSSDFNPNDPNGDGVPNDAWSTGPAVLGNEDATLSVPLATELNLGPTTYYFRTEFSFTGAPAATQLQLQPLVDDGAIFYLNGNEIARINMPQGAVDFLTPALSAVRNAAPLGEIVIRAEDLVVGTNVLSVEVHQAAEDAPSLEEAVILTNGGLQLVEEGPVAASAGAAAPVNLATGAVPFALDELGLGVHRIQHLNDGKYGNAFSWIGNGATGTSGPFVGINLGATPIQLSEIAFGRSNVLTGDPCGGGVCTDRTLGLYRLQYTTVPNPSATTPDSSWSEIGTLHYQSPGGTNFDFPHRRHRYTFTPVMATGIRLIVPATGLASGTAVDEIELYGGEGGSDIELSSEDGYSISWNGNEGEHFNTASPAVVPDNLVLSTPSIMPFGSSQASPGAIAAVADGQYGDAHSWTSSGTSPAFVGLAFGTALTFDRIAFGRDNGDNTDPGCPGGQCTDAALGSYTLQITDVANPNASTPQTGDRGTGWESVATVTYHSASDSFQPHLRHEFQVRDGGSAITASGLRLVVSDSATTIDEIELSLTPVPTGVVLEPATGFNVTWDGNDGDFFEPSEAGQVPDNLALASNGSTAFASGELGPSIGLGYHRISNINDGAYGNGKSWIGSGVGTHFLGVSLGGLTQVDRIAWGRDNGRLSPASEECGGTCIDRSLGQYRLQFTTASNPGQNTPDTGVAATGWQTVGDITYEFQVDAEVGGGFTPYLRHEFVIRQQGELVEATAIRLVVPTGTAIDELEVYGPEAPDVVFGLALTATELLPDPANVVIDEVTAGGTNPFWLDIANRNAQPVDLAGYVLVSNNATRPSYVLPAGTLAGGGFRQITAAQLGYVPAVGERLFLYGPGQTTLADAVIVDTVLRGRSTEHDGRWLYPVTATPGGENQFAFEHDIVINEIMYHAPGFSTADVPAVYDVTTLVPIDASSLWRYRDTASGLPSGWAGSAHSVGTDGWKSGPAPVGFEDATLDHPIRTPVANPATQSPFVVTYYFEREFNLADVPNARDLSIVINHYVDDGAVFYINGVEFHRYNMPTGAVASNTLAATSVSNAGRVDGLVIPTDLLLPGTNRISVEVHQGTNGSSDVVFAAEILQRQVVSPFIPGVPYTERQEEWIELYNRSATRSIDLSGWQLSDAVQFEFPAGTVLGPREHVVVARNAAAMQANYPGLSNLVGQFSGSLSNAGERIVLTDAVGNPADDVAYFDEGRWDDLADGGGSSLQLLDPLADNSVPEAWRASDESAQGQWQTITYRGPILAEGFSNGVNNFYRELILGLLDSGSVLIDDISVIEDPDGTSIERVQNGTFEEDTLGDAPSKWRIQGTHQGTVVADPDQPGNQALMLTTTGPMEDRFNHAETTFVDNAVIRDGIDYEISFRARWMGGSNQLNSHLYFNRLPRTTLLERPTRYGSPGAVNFDEPVNLGPTYESLAHFPVVPNPSQPVTITVEAADPDNVASMTLWYRVDNGTFQSVAMEHVRDDIYQALVPGQSASRVVQFYVEGIDGEGASSYFPAAGPDSRALYKVQDGLANDGLLHDLRIIMTPADTQLLHAPTNTMSNARLGATVVYNETEVFYDAGVRLKGSNAGRNNSAFLGFNISFDPMQPFRGVHDSIAIDRSGRSGPTPQTQDEILIKHIGNAAGDIAYMYDDLVHVITPNSSHTRPALLMLSSYDDGFLDTQFEDGSDGTVFKLDIAYVPNGTVDGNPESPKLPFPYSHPQPTKDLQDLGDDKEAYRPHILIRNNRAADDYSRIIEASKALSLSGSALLTAVDGLIDYDQWARVFALQSLTGAADVYTRGGLHHNIDFYVRPEDDKVLALPWDWDFAFTAPTNQSLIGNFGNGGKLMTTPSISRLVHGHMLDIINTTFNNSYLDPWIDHYGQVAGQNLSPIKSYVAARRSFVLANLPAQIPFAITTNGGQNISTDAATINLSGQGWIDVRQIELVHTGESLPVRWMNDSVWQVTIPLHQGANPIELRARDHQGAVVGSDTIVVTTTSDNPVASSLRITELNYNPAEPTEDELASLPGLDNNDFEFIELQNTGNLPLQLANAHFERGVTFTFGDVSLAPGERVLVASNLEAFRLRYGLSPRVVGEFQAGNLSNAGERLTLQTASGEVIVDFTYGDGQPWPQWADGAGGTLELISSTTPVDQLGDFGSWRGSTNNLGSPGTSGAAPLSVIVNEVLTHTDASTVRTDSIELYNATPQAIDLTGWYLSDSSDELLKFAIPAGTILGAGEYLVFDESDFNPTPATPLPHHFALDGDEGDDVWLVVTDGQGVVTQLVDEVHFDAAATGTSWGRIPSVTGRLVPMARLTLGSENLHPLVGPIVISEVQFAPAAPSAAALAADPSIVAADLRFVEIHNPTQLPVSLTDWRVRGGSDFDFAAGTVLDAGDTIVLVTFDPSSAANVQRVAAFRAHYGIGSDIRLMGELVGDLFGDNQQVWLQRPGETPPDDPSVTPRLTEDVVRYRPLPAWPSDVQDTGRSLQRILPTSFGDLATSWRSADANPGSVTFSNAVAGDITGDQLVNATDIDALYDALRADTRVTTNDLNGDMVVDDADVRHLIETILNTLPGDANLDGSVDAADFGIWQQHKFADYGQSWRSGDFNGDAVVDGLDFHMWLRHRFTANLAAPAATLRTPRAALGRPAAEADVVVEQSDTSAHARVVARGWLSSAAHASLARRTGQDVRPSRRSQFSLLPASNDDQLPAITESYATTWADSSSDQTRPRHRPVRHQATADRPAPSDASAVLIDLALEHLTW